MSIFADVARLFSTTLVEPIFEFPFYINGRSIFVITFKLSLIRMNKFNILNSYDTKIIYESWKNSGYFIRRNEKTRYE